MHFHPKWAFSAGGFAQNAIRLRLALHKIETVRADDGDDAVPDAKFLTEMANVHRTASGAQTVHFNRGFVGWLAEKTLRALLLKNFFFFFDVGAVC